MLITLQPLLLGALLAFRGVGPPPSSPQEPLPSQVRFQIQYDTSKSPSDPDYLETLANVLYPPGKGPSSQGFPAEPLPVFIFLRGGNGNSIELGEVTFGSQVLSASPFGFLGVQPNMPVIENGEDYTLAVDGVARLIQHLRWRAVELNLDPQRIFLIGRSFGCVVAYGVAYRFDFADSGGGPELSQSSRPDYLVARFGPSHLPCIAPDVTLSLIHI